MSELLQPYESIVSEGRTKDVAKQIFALLNREDVADLLRERGQRGVIARNTHSVEQCVENIQLMAASSDSAFVIGASENPERVVGVGTSMSDITLRRIKHSFVPAAIARKSSSLSEEVPLHGNQLFAWTEPSRLEELETAYRTLKEQAPNTGRAWTGDTEVILSGHWTIEPVNAGRIAVHCILQEAGFYADDRDYYDDGELKLETVPRSILYKTM